MLYCTSAVERLQARVQYRQPLAACDVSFSADGDGLYVEFDEPRLHVAEEQVFVMYHGEVCLGGAIIKARLDLERPTEGVLLPG